MKTIKFLLAVLFSIAVAACGSGNGGGATTTTASAPGSLDTSFNTDGKLTTVFGTSGDYAHAMAIQSDGKIVAAGYSSNASNGTHDVFALARYNTDGSLDTSFDADGKLATAFGTGNAFAHAIAIQSDGKIVAAGYADRGGPYDFALARYNSDGSLDTSFDTDGKLTTTYANDVTAIAIQSDGKIVAAGNSWNGANYDFALVRYYP